MEPDAQAPFKVVILDSEQVKIKRWIAWAKQQGAQSKLLKALKTIQFRLTWEPLEWGEPRYLLHELELELRLGIFSMLNVWYGVSRSNRTGFVKVVQFHASYPGGAPPE